MRAIVELRGDVSNRIMRRIKHNQDALYGEDAT
jgi:hypothetical protein